MYVDASVLIAEMHSANTVRHMEMQEKRQTKRNTHFKKCTRNRDQKPSIYGK